VTSAIDLKPPLSFDQLLRRDKKSPDVSARESPSQQHRDSFETRAQQQIQAEKEARRRVKPEDVEKAKAENFKREEELRRSLKDAEEVGMDSTRRLDDTYYAILEKASILRSTVASLQQLVKESKKIHQHFREDSGRLVDDTKQNIEQFGNFDEQEKSITELVSRLSGSKDKTDKLNKRLEAARIRIENYEHRENAKQSKRRKQWQATWGAMVGIAVLILFLVLLRHRRKVAESLDGVGVVLVEMGDVAATQLLKLKAPSPSPSPSPSVGEDPHLKQLFDEL